MRIKETKLVIIAAVLGIIIAAGTMLGRWASEESARTEAWYAEAMSVLVNR
mgnify:CR=1 FL=1